MTIKNSFSIKKCEIGEFGRVHCGSKKNEASFQETAKNFISIFLQDTENFQEFYRTCDEN